MKIYCIGGLGADKRVFDYLNINLPLEVIDWIPPIKNENIKEYAQRLVKNISFKPYFILLGVSFGGILAVEISKIIKPKLLILISSVELSLRLRLAYRVLGRIKILKFIPKRLFLPPEFLANFLFGAKNKKLLNKIIKDTDLDFAKWAVNQLVCWHNDEVFENCIKISGAKDKLMPSYSMERNIVVKGGGHFMIVDKAKEISGIINKELTKCG